MPTEIIRSLLAINLMAYVERAFAELRPGVPFHYGLYLRAMCHRLELVEQGKIKRLLILLPPRHLKSHCTSICYPAWVIGRDPSKRMLTISYGANLAEEFSIASRRLMLADWNRVIFPALQIDPKKASATQLLTTRNGGRMATSVGGTLTGKGGDILIIDDPSKAEDVASETQREKLWDWFTGTAMTRLDNPKAGAVVVVAQRLHIDDLPGRLIATGQWNVLNLPAVETMDRKIPLPDGRVWTRPKGDILLPDHMGEAELDAIRKEMGSAKFEAQFQQTPIPGEGNIVKPEWFATIPAGLRPHDYEATVQSWDVAAVPGESNDFSVCTTWGLIGNHIDLLDVYRSKHDPPQLLKVARELRQTWKPDLLVVETQGVGQSLKAFLWQDDRRGVRGVAPKENKVERMSKETFMLERREVRLPQDTSWKEVFLDESTAFPNGKFDDQVDSMSQALFAIRIRPHELRHCSRYKG